jgi:hypothetical protein
MIKVLCYLIMKKYKWHILEAIHKVDFLKDWGHEADKEEQKINWHCVSRVTYSLVLNTSLFAIYTCQYLLQYVCKYIAASSEGVCVYVCVCVCVWSLTTGRWMFKECMYCKLALLVLGVIIFV